MVIGVEDKIDRKMKYRTLLYFFVLFVFASCSGEEEETRDEQPEVVQVVFSSEQGQYAGIALPYRRAVISVSDGGKAALVLYLHGGTSKGTDNAAPIEEEGGGVIGDYLAVQDFNSVFIVPQCSKDKSWGGMMNGALKALIDEYVAGGTVDAGRIYILGGSMGGSGTWSMLSAYLGLFAAAMPVAGNPSGCDAANVAGTPVLRSWARTTK